MDSPRQMIEAIEDKHTAAYYELAAQLFAQGQKDEGVFWFYVGQLRYRFHLEASPGLDPSGDPALFGSLSEVVGRPINEHAFGDIPKLAAIIDRVLAWDAGHVNGFTKKDGHAKALEGIREGLAEMKDTVLRDQEEIKRQRRENGLE
jgi:hypothetical protein